MVFKSIIATACACFTVVSFNVSAAVISTDWLTAGDNLITHDTVSGLEWLDLTETNNLSYDFVTGQLVTDGQFAGWRYATNTEVVALLNNFGIDLSAGQPTSIDGFQDPGVAQAAGFLGNIVNEYSPETFPHGVLGVTSDQPNLGIHAWIGAYTGADITYYHPEDWKNFSDDTSRVHTGSYLVKTSVIPVPPAILLFGSGLIGLIGAVRRKRS